MFEIIELGDIEMEQVLVLLVLGLVVYFVYKLLNDRNQKDSEEVHYLEDKEVVEKTPAEIKEEAKKAAVENQAEKKKKTPKKPRKSKKSKESRIEYK